MWKFAAGQPRMQDPPKRDPYKPQQPDIPGVPERVAVEKAASPDQSSGDSERLPVRMPPTWVWLAGSGVLLLVIGVVWWSHGLSPKEAAPVPESAAPTSAEETSKLTEKISVAPGQVATTAELAKAWSSKRFIFRNPLTSEETPAMVVHLPDGTFWGFSLREPYGNCELEYVTDLQKLRDEYNFRADHPMVGDPCNRTVFDLMRYGNGPGGLIRGEIAQGAAVRPPLAIEIRTHGKQVFAVRME